MKKRITAILAALSMLTSAAAFSARSLALSEEPSDGERFVAIATVREGCSPALCAELADRIAGTRLLEVYDTLLDGFALELDADAYRILAGCGFIESLRPGGEYSPAADSRKLAEAYPELDSERANAAAELIGAGAASEFGLDGSGVVVAVIDAGFDTSHNAFRGTEITASLTSDRIAELFGSRTLHASRQSFGAEEVYVNKKLPFVFDYAGNDTDLSSSLNHGTHVAGIIGARPTETSFMQGIAPGCQLLFMKVFDDNGVSAPDHLIIAALEDAVKLGADVINLSLGRYSGSARVNQMSGMDKLLKKAEEIGCTVVCAAGNESDSASRSLVSEGEAPLPPAAYTDYGTVGYPASADSAFAAGSVSNRYEYGIYFLLGDRAVGYSDTNRECGVLAGDFASKFDRRTLRYTVIPGIGSEADYEGLDLTGRLAVADRGEISFVEKANIAAEHGAVGVIVCNNADESVSMELTGARIPAIIVSREDGELLKSAERRSVSFARSYRYLEKTDAGRLSEFSSVGCTPSLTLKPDIVGVGGGVYSTVQGGYGGLTGTSMAAPQISGVCALLCQRIPADGGRVERLKRIMMNTASPILQDNGVEYSPRFQGAGLVDLPAALSPELELVYTPNGKAKAELSDLLGSHFPLDVTLTNLTDGELSVSLGVSLTGDSYILRAPSEGAGEPVYYSTRTAEPDTRSVISALGETRLNRAGEDYTPLSLTLAPGESRVIPIEFEFDRRLSDELDAIFTNGRFVEGYVFCSTGRSSYSLPYMGYHGDWSSAPILDEEGIFGGSSLRMNVNGLLVKAGMNIYAEKPVFEPARIAFSPNGDGAADTVYLQGELLRNASAGELTVLDKEGEQVCRVEVPGEYYTKSAGVDAVGRMILPWSGGDGLYSRYRLPDGEYTLTYAFTLDFPGEIKQVISFPIVLDTEKPKLVSISLDAESGRLTVTAVDRHMLQYIKLFESDADTSSQLFVCGEPDGDGLWRAEFELADEPERLYVELVDQAFNSLVERFSPAELSE